MACNSCLPPELLSFRTEFSPWKDPVGGRRLECQWKSQVRMLLLMLDWSRCCHNWLMGHQHKKAAPNGRHILTTIEQHASVSQVSLACPRRFSLDPSSAVAGQFVGKLTPNLRVAAARPTDEGVIISTTKLLPHRIRTYVRQSRARGQQKF